MRRLGTFVVGATGLIAVALSGCADQPYDPSAPAVDPSAPVIHIKTPTRGTFTGPITQLAVAGTASDDSGLASVQVNGVDAVLSADGSWIATIPVAPGTQLIHAIARDRQGNVGKESRAVVVGRLQPIASSVPRAIAASMSAQTFDAIGRGITGFLQHGDVESLVAPRNPVIDVGGGPDCNYVQASIARISFGSATRVTLMPEPGGLALDVELDQVSLGMHLAYSVLCLPGSRDITVAASHVKVTGVLDVGVHGGGFDIALTGQSIQLTGFDVDLGGLPGDVVDWLHLDTALGPALGVVTEHFVVPLLNSALDGLNDTRTIDVLGTPVDIRLSPAQIAFDASGALIELDSELRAQGDAASPGYVYIANQQPAMSTDHGFALAVADDTANQLLASFWAARGLDRTFDLTTGSYGDVGKLYDRVQLSAAVPPFLDASGGSLRLTIGDLLATFRSGDTVATQIAVSAEVAIKVVTDPSGKPRLDVGTPTTYVDVLDDNVAGANVLSNAQFEVVASFALSRVIAVGSGAVGAVPLPSFGGVAVHDLAIAEQTGYLVIDGAVE
jgi:Glucodextranase, domain B